MNCPQCGLPMEEGNLHTQKYPFWTRQELRFFWDPTDKVEIGPAGDDDTTVFTRDHFPTFPGAGLCRACGLICFTGTLIEKSNTKRNTKKE
ncbi:PF20097 family protein [uncultured Oscillibacter sp.]|uniref:PF20097 family protein n=1 Tax=uncultured Oscillibacter sp. TaxID=876091 RepID=UPI00261AB3F8|nr:PF20097 family protein [uncultured Oscillibacter sp.]